MHSRRAVLHLVEGTPDDGAADMTLDPSSKLPENHVHGNGLPATFVPGRKNVYEGYWAADESYKKSPVFLFHYF